MESKLLTLETKFKQDMQIINDKITIYQNKQQELNETITKYQENITTYTKIKDSSFYDVISVYFDENLILDKYEQLNSNQLYNLDRKILDIVSNLSNKLKLLFDKITSNTILNLYPPKTQERKEILFSANKLRKFEQNNQIKFFKDSLSSTYSQTLSHYDKEIGELLDSQATIQKSINKITKKLSNLKDIKVIQSVQLKYAPTDDIAVQLLIQLKTLYNENAFQADTNLFNQLGANDEFNQKVLEIFERLNKYLYENIKKEELTLDDSFVLLFRAMENGNDTGFQQVLNNIGSNGTDVMIKVMVYITMLNLALEQSVNKHQINEDFYLHCILDEVGILSPKYLKELIEFANGQNIRFINGAPDERIVQSYKRIYMLRTTKEHKTITNEIVAQI
jgi:prefoldin subunit 5